ncbi:MAG: ABC transporter ATP-binding protein [Oscillospiraceae bacterium]|jgi:putative ABC transport system ATP-binding protein|nr:ABC transporter ATP-binding protein [Oscillospiraceae bacterium]
MLKVTKLIKSFNRGTPNEKLALDGISLVIRPGDFVTVIGGNGAGKSTLLNCVAGVFPPDSGKILIDDADVTRLSEHNRAKYLGRVFQDPMMGTAADMTIEENLALANRRGTRRTLRWQIQADERKRYKEMLAELNLGLEDRLTSRVGLLSGGQRQALTLLMATLRVPKLLLLDEHTAALDPKTAETVLDLTEKYIKQSALTALMVTHNMRNALRYGNRLLMMHNGRAVVDVAGEAKQILEVNDLMRLFERSAGEELASDRMLLAD